MLFISALKTVLDFCAVFFVIAVYLLTPISGRSQTALDFIPESKAPFSPPINADRVFSRTNYSSAHLLSGKSLIEQGANLTPTAGELDVTLNSNIFFDPGSARVAARQADGKILVGGYFRLINGVRANSLVRLNPDLSLDSTFNAKVNSTIFSITIQPDGKILIGGFFERVNDVNRSTVARLNADGSLDTGFDPGAGADSAVYEIAVQPDGRILLAGAFLGFNGVGNVGIARLNSDGSVDTSFVSPLIPLMTNSSGAIIANSLLYGVALQSDGKIIISGSIIRSRNPPLDRVNIARLNSNGSFDTSFNAAVTGGQVYKARLQPDNKILIGGFFTQVGGVSRNRVARLNADGALDTSFDPGTGTNGNVYSVFLESNGGILIAGSFTTLNGANQRGLARLNSGGALESTFQPTEIGLNGIFYDALPAANNQILAVGSLTSTNAAFRNTIVIYNSNGAIDTSAGYNSISLGGVRAIAPLANGKILVGGSFTTVSGAVRNSLARLNADGSLDSAFNSSRIRNSLVRTIVVQPDEKILVGGISVGNANLPTANIARINPDGTADTTFNQTGFPTNQGVNQIVVQPDGKILATYNAVSPQGFASGGIIRLNADGTVDTSFTPGNAFLDALALQPDGKILTGGSGGFCFINSQTGTICYNGVTRLNVNGSLDTTFRTGLSPGGSPLSQVYSLIVQPDGQILVGGNLYTASSSNPTGVVRLNPSGTIDGSFNTYDLNGSAAESRVDDLLLLPNGKIAAGGTFDGINGIAARNIIRLNSDGSYDSSFNASADDVIYDLASQADGKLLVGGYFEKVNGTDRPILARLLTEAAPARRPQFDYDGDGRADVSVFRPASGTWYVQRSTAGFLAQQWGANGDLIAPADFDGDGKTDLAVFRPANGFWYIFNLANGGVTARQFGQSGDVPRPADFDGDGRADLAVFRPSTGTWYRLSSSNNQTIATQFGESNDAPLAADFDGDGRADLAVFRPSTGFWYRLQSSNNQTIAAQFGQSGDVPSPGDYDGDGRADLAVFRPASGFWYAVNSSNSTVTARQFGQTNDAAAAADYDGDGKTDLAVFRPSSGVWYQQLSMSGFASTQFGQAGDVPTPSAFTQP